jgi:hypothetical protein
MILCCRVRMFVFLKKSSYLVPMKQNLNARGILLTVLCLSTASWLLAGDRTSSNNKYVSCKVSVENEIVRAGATTSLLISFTPQKGISVNSRPPLDVSFDSTSVITKVDSLILPKSTKEDRLDTSKPVRVPFQLSKELQAGKFKLSGTLTYYYCSAAEGWCSKFQQPFTVVLTITK